MQIMKRGAGACDLGDSYVKSGSGSVSAWRLGFY